VVRPYRFLTEARNEFEEQIRYFDERAGGLGDQFIQEVEAAVRTIRVHPESGTQISRLLRRSVLHAFPVSLYYVATDDEIIIVAVAGQRRRPRYWRKRVKGLAD
jgi:toxin ParE1/3/4